MNRIFVKWDDVRETEAAIHFDFNTYIFNM